MINAFFIKTPFIYNTNALKLYYKIGGETIKKLDVLIIFLILLIGSLSLIGLKLYEDSNSSGNIYAKVTYDNQLILMIDLETNQFEIYDTVYKDDIITTRSSEGIYYVPGKVTDDMQALYEVDEFARDNSVIGIKLQVLDSKISVVYQESPKDICQLQDPTNSHLTPIVCLPNELVIDVYTNMDSDQFIPDSVLE